MLTARQQEIWQFLVEYTDGHGYPPTVREIGEAVGSPHRRPSMRISRTSSAQGSSSAIPPSRVRST